MLYNLDRNLLLLNTLDGLLQLGKFLFAFLSLKFQNVQMKFKDFVALYMKDADPRLRETTLANKHYLFNKKVLPYFGEMPINAIKPTDIRNWQNELINYRRPNGRGYSPTYLRTINN